MNNEAFDRDYNTELCHTLGPPDRLPVEALMAMDVISRIEGVYRDLIAQSRETRRLKTSP